MKKKKNQGIDDCNTFFFSMKISISFYWRNDTPTFCNLIEFTPSQFVPGIVSPLPFFIRTWSSCITVCAFFQRTHFFHWLPLKMPRVPRGSVVKCFTRNLGVLGSSLTGSSGFFRGSVLGQDTSEPSLVLVKPRKA